MKVEFYGRISNLSVLTTFSALKVIFLGEFLRGNKTLLKIEFSIYSIN